MKTTFQELTIIMARVAAAFPNSKPDKMTMQIYFELLGDIPADELKYAVDFCIIQPGRVFPPTVGEIREEWLEYRETRPSQQKQIATDYQPVYVPMPKECQDELDVFFKAKGHRSKYREIYMHISEESRK